MSELKPCPFCGGDANAIPSEHADDCYFMVMRNVKLNKDSADCSFVFDAIKAWNRREQPAQAGHVPEASCGECGKKASDGWALYCVACMEEAGLPAVTDSPPLMHSCTSSLGKTPDSTAQAGQVLTDAEIQAAWVAHGLDDCAVEDFARAIEQAVLAKRVPQWLPIETAPQDWGVTKFDVWANDARFADCWWGKATYEQGEPGIVYQSDYDCNGPVDSYVRNATHWMPLPPPPGIVGKEGA